MAVFDVAQHVIAQSAGLINGSTAIDASTLAAMQTTLESKGVGELIGIFFQTSIIFTLMGILSALIFVIVYARMIEIYLTVSLAPIPFARRIHLAPFSLAECEQLFALNDMVMTRKQMIESYMILGGIPHYMCLYDSRLSLAQNINELCFKEHGQLANEYHNLFYSLYDKPEKHLAILDALAAHRVGLTRAELSKVKAIGGGSVLTKDLLELEECGFIRKYINCTKGEGELFYQLTDPFVLFYIGFIKNKKFDSWNEYINTPGYNAWCGNAFEIVCINHIEKIKSALGIRGIETHEFAWRSIEPGGGAQIDLVIKRKDGVSNLCEMKFTNEEYSIDEDEHRKIENRLSRFQTMTETKDAIHVTLICGNGYKRSKYSGIVQNVIVGDDLFT